MQVNGSTHRQYLSVALPMTLAAMASPLPGIVDTAILGHLEHVHYLTAVATGSTVIGLLVWSFSFLRMGTTATTARAFGADDPVRCRLLLGQSLTLATLLGAAIVLLQSPLLSLGFTLIQPPGQSFAWAVDYTRIRIFAAPAILGTFCIVGWLIGTQKARSALALVVLVNTANVGLDFLFILGLGMNSDGAAWASLIAEYLGLLAGLYLVQRIGRTMTLQWPRHQLLNFSSYTELFAVNRHLLVRTACLIFTFAFFTAQGARQGAVPLAANAILMQLFFLFSFTLDGFAQAAEAMTGQAIGRHDEKMFYRVCRLSFLWGLALATATTTLYVALDTLIIGIFTNLNDVAAAALRYFRWLAVVPLVAVCSFMLDGIFLGAGKSRSMQNIMIVAVLGIFLPTWYLSKPMANDGLWMAFVLFMLARTVMMAAVFLRISRGTWLPGKAPPSGL